MKSYLALSFIFLFTVTFGQVKWIVSADTATKWYYHSGDEFNDVNLDRSKWITQLPWSKNVVSSGCYYTDQNTTVDSGYVYFKLDHYKKYERLEKWEISDSYVKKHTERLKDSTYLFDYSGGLLWSAAQYKYGQFEIRFKSPEGSGIWPAFWLYGGNPNYEIDFFEMKGERNDQVHLDVHCPSGCANYKSSFFDLSKGWGRWIKTTNYFKNDFNTISGIWDEQGIKFYLNDVLTAYYKGTFNVKMNLTTGIGIAQNDGPFHPGENKDTQLPAFMIVDYIRVWSDKDTLNKIAPNYFEASKPAEPSFKCLPKKTKLNDKRLNAGSITLLQVSNTKYSLNTSGNNLGNIQIDVLDQLGKSRLSYPVNAECTLLDLKEQGPGTYNIIINVLGQTLTHSITNP